jgi:hypothetical protein
MLGLLKGQQQMPKATSKDTEQLSRSAPRKILGGPVKRPHPGVRSVSAKAMQRAVKELFRERALEERATPTKA